MWQLNIEGKILIFTNLAISKVVRLAWAKDLASSPIAQLEKIQKQFIWKNRSPKLKHTTLCMEYEQGVLKNYNILSKIASLQCSCVKRLNNDGFHAWKVIHLYLIKDHLGKNFVFHSNLSIRHKVFKKLPKFYQEILVRWGKYLSSHPKLLSAVASQIFVCLFVFLSGIPFANIHDPQDSRGRRRLSL